MFSSFLVFKLEENKNQILKDSYGPHKLWITVLKNMFWLVITDLLNSFIKIRNLRLFKTILFYFINKSVFANTLSSSLIALSWMFFKNKFSRTKNLLRFYFFRITSSQHLFMFTIYCLLLLNCELYSIVFICFLFFY